MIILQILFLIVFACAITMCIYSIILSIKYNKLIKELEYIKSIAIFELDPDMEYLIDGKFYRLLPSDDEEELANECNKILKEYYENQDILYPDQFMQLTEEDFKGEE